MAASRKYTWPIVWHGMDPGLVKRYRLVDEPWQYEAYVAFNPPFGPREWLPVIELTYVKPSATVGS